MQARFSQHTFVWMVTLPLVGSGLALLLRR